MSKGRQADIQAAITEVLRRASYDLDFRKLALRDARAALGNVANGALPRDLPYKFVDAVSSVSNGNGSIALPEYTSGHGELTEKELDQVAGGCDIATCVMTM